MPTQSDHHEDCQPKKHLVPLIAKSVQSTRQALGRIPDLAFLPWIGDQYWEGISSLAGQKVLILSESHYEWCEVCRRDGPPRDESLTIRCVLERATLTEISDEERGHWQTIEIAVLSRLFSDGSTPGPITKHWHDVAYANFVQALLGSAVIRPKSDYWKRSQGPFRALLEKLRPEFLIVFGRAVWNHMPQEERPLSQVGNGRERIERCRYDLPGCHKTFAVVVPHPSYRAGVSDWGPWANRIYHELDSWIRNPRTD